MRKLFPLVVVMLATAACKDDPPPAPPKTEAKKPTPVPSDFVVNDFFTDDTKVKGVAGDGGVAMGDLKTDGGSGAPGASQAPAGDGRAAKLVDAGQEPKVARRYAFAAGKAESRVGQVRVAMTVEVPGAPPQQQAQPAVEVTVKLTPKGLQKGAFPVDVKIDKLGLAEGQGLDAKSAAEAQKQLSPFLGLTAKVDVSARGVVGEMAFSGDEKMQKQGAAEILELLQQTLEFIAVPFPEEPIGVGAKWDVESVSTSQGSKVTTVTHFLMKEWAGDAGTLTAEVVRSSPKAPLRDPRMPGAQLEVNGKGTYTFQVKLDRPTVKVSGESTTLAKIEVPKGEKGGAPQTIVQTVKTRHSLEAPAK